MLGRTLPLATIVAVMTAAVGCGSDEEAANELPPGMSQESGAYYQAVMDLGPSLYWRLDEPDSHTAATDVSGNGNNGYWSGKIRHGEPGAVDGNDAIRIEPSRKPTFLRAYDYSPYEVGGQLSVVGITELERFERDFQTLFSSTGPGNRQCTLEVAEKAVRWYSNVKSDFLAAANDWRRAWPATGEWVWWAFTWDDSTTDAQFYVRGVRQERTHTSLIGATEFIGDEGDFQVGNRGKGDYEILNGLMDEVAIFDRILSPDEVMGLYRASALKA